MATPRRRPADSACATPPAADPARQAWSATTTPGAHRIATSRPVPAPRTAAGTPCKVAVCRSSAAGASSIQRAATARLGRSVTRPPACACHNVQTARPARSATRQRAPASATRRAGAPVRSAASATATRRHRPVASACATRPAAGRVRRVRSATRTAPPAPAACASSTRPAAVDAIRARSATP
jgi:hypothetical protein